MLFRSRLCVAVLVGTAVGAPAATSPKPAIPSKARSTAAQAVRLRGHVQPRRQIELMVPLEEVLHSIEVEENQRVTSGQTLARLDDRVQRAIVEAADLRASVTAEVESAAVDIELAEDDLRMITEAFNGHAVNSREVTQARLELARAQAIHAATLENQQIARMNLRVEQQRLAQYTVTAPFDGYVVAITSHPGSMLSIDDSILVLADLDTLEAKFNLPAHMYGRLQVGDRYTMAASAPVNAELNAVLRRADMVIDTASQTFGCVFTIENAGASLPAGFTVELIVPAETIYAQTDGS